MGLEDLLSNVTHELVRKESYAHKKRRDEIATTKEILRIEAQAQTDAQIQVMEAHQKAIRNAQIEAEKKLEGMVSSICLVLAIVLAFLLLKNNSLLVKISFFSKFIIRLTSRHSFRLYNRFIYFSEGNKNTLKLNDF